MRSTKRRTALLAAAVPLLLILAGCAGPGGSGDGGADPENAFKIGLLAPMTGFVSSIGTDIKQGWDYYWEQNGTKVGKYEVVTKLEDDASDPDTSLNKAVRLVKEENVDVVVGPLLSNQGLAVADYLVQEGVPNFTLGSADELTQQRHNPLVLRTGIYSGSQMAFPGGQWAHDQGYKTAATLCADYAFGWESCGGFSSTFTAAGGKVTQQLWYPTDAADFSSYATQLLNSDADVIFIGSAGGTDASNILRAASDFGLLKKIPILTNCCTLDQATLQDVGDIALGLNSVSPYAEGAPDISDFVTGFEKKYGVIPSAYAAGAYTTAQIIAATLAGMDTKVSGQDFVDQVKSADLSHSLWGPVTFDDYNNLVGRVFIREVVKRDDGKLWNVPIKTFDDVSQFWTFDPTEVIENGPFTPDWQGK
ncbi:ABC transporter substrate-binding protein [Microbacterium sp. NPDC058389]|uniref:ABC transporter substrate-binding protein n=1 Tax=Microbacterium sp. NPDC058389 TaxID=3346475 RepID=UPI00365E572D